MLVAGLVAVVACAGGVYAYDSTQATTIAAGVTVGGVHVGGLTRDAARDRLRARLLKPLRAWSSCGPAKSASRWRRARRASRPTSMRWSTTPIKRSRDGSIVARTWRGLTGAELDASVKPAVSYSRAAVQRLVDKVRVADQPQAGRSRRLTSAGQRVRVRRSLPGLAVDAPSCASRCARTLTSRRARARFAPSCARPRRRSRRAARREVQGRADRRPHALPDQPVQAPQARKSYPIAVGVAGLETPAGRYTIQNKAINPAWHVPNSPWAGSLAGTVIPGGTRPTR